MSGEYRFRIGDMDVVDEEVRAKRRANALFFISILIALGTLAANIPLLGVAALAVGTIYRLYVAVVY